MPQQRDQQEYYDEDYDPQYNQNNDSMANLNNIMTWPLTGKCETILVNQTDPEESWIYTKENFQVESEGTVNIADIPFGVLLDEKYNKDNTLVMKILIDPFHP